MKNHQLVNGDKQFPYHTMGTGWYIPWGQAGIFTCLHEWLIFFNGKLVGYTVRPMDGMGIVVYVYVTIKSLEKSTTILHSERLCTVDSYGFPMQQVDVTLYTYQRVENSRYITDHLNVPGSLGLNLG